MKGHRYWHLLVRVSILLFLIAAIVGGFWIDSFHEYGTSVLTVLCLTILMMLVLEFKMKLPRVGGPRRKPEASLEFSSEEIRMIRHGLKTSSLRRPTARRDMLPGDIVSAKLEGRDAEIMRLRIVGIERKYLADLGKGELEALGMPSRGELYGTWRIIGGRRGERVFGELVYFERLETEGEK